MSETQTQEQEHQDLAVAIRDEDWAVVGMPSGGAFKAMMAYSRALVGTPFLPKSIVKDVPPDRQGAVLMSVILSGKEMGLSPMQSLRSFWLSPDGRLGSYADSMMGIMLKAGIKFEWAHLDNEKAVLKSTRGEMTYISEFTVEDAKRAGIWQKERSVWPKYPKAMLKARVIGDTFRTIAPDLGGSQMYTREELEDMAEEGTPTARDIAEQEADAKAAADPKLQVKKKEKKQPESAPIDVKAEPAPETKQTPAETKAEPAETKAALAAETKPEEKPAPEPAKPADPKKLFIERKKALIARAGMKDSTELDLFILGYFGHPSERPKNPEPYFAAFDKLEAAIDYDQRGLQAFRDEPQRLGTMLKDIELSQIKGDNLEPAPGEVVDAEFDEVEDEPAHEEPKPDPKPETKPAPEKVVTMPKSAAKEDPLGAQFNWSEDTCAVARSIMKSKKLDEKRITQLVKTFKIDQLSDNDAETMLRLYSFDANAFLLKRRADEAGMDTQQLVALVNRHFKGIIRSDSDPVAVSAAITNALTEVTTNL